MNKDLLIFPTNFYDTALALPGSAFKFLTFITLRKIKTIDTKDKAKFEQTIAGYFSLSESIVNLILLADSGYFTTNADGSVFTITFEYKK